MDVYGHVPREHFFAGELLEFAFGGEVVNSRRKRVSIAG